MVRDQSDFTTRMTRDMCDLKDSMATQVHQLAEHQGNSATMCVKRQVSPDKQVLQTDQLAEHQRSSSSMSDLEDGVLPQQVGINVNAVAFPDTGVTPSGWYYFGHSPPMSVVAFWKQFSPAPPTLVESGRTFSEQMQPPMVARPPCDAAEVIAMSSGEPWELAPQNCTTTRSQMPVVRIFR